MGRIDINSADVRIGSGYPAPYDEPCKERKRVRLGDVAGLTQFGVNLLRLPPERGAKLAVRLWPIMKRLHTNAPTTGASSTSTATACACRTGVK